MKYLFKIANYIFHPVLIPFAGATLYFIFSARFFPIEIIQAKLLAVAIVTIFIPVVFLYLLKTLGLVSTIFLKTPKERIYPLLLHAIIIYGLVLDSIFNKIDFPELYCFFVGILLSTLSSLLLSFFRLKVSLHMAGIAGLMMFIIALSLHFKINILVWIALLFAIMGLVASARLHNRAHHMFELIIGFFFGVVPQLFMLKYWL